MSASFEATASLPPRTPITSPAAGLRLRTEGPSPGLLDGSWWPRSRHLLHELPSLTDLLDPLCGRVTRVAVNPALRPVVPHTPLLLSSHTGRRDLLVIPPETDAASAARLMTAVSDHGDQPLTASALVAADRVGAAVLATDRRLTPEETSEYEGGTTSTASAVPRPPHPWSSSPRRPARTVGRSTRPAAPPFPTRWIPRTEAS
ncbi:DUF5994 family protein [Streptomyces sp. NBC_00452]|uniref:DUF5994 family protein n=1 Tax=Streptomyces sp. NBC_00452 TaxID=2975746 RepID=UPI002B1DDD67|nr:DUF5994 family protein [Streptomyces sp. NBC_00452]